MHELSLTDAKRRIAAVYDLTAPGYARDAARFFHSAAEWLVEFAGVRAGQRVLDVATGTGAAALAASRTVGPDGCVVGVDIAPAMLEQARASARREGRTNILLREADADALPFSPESFDVAVSAAGLFFLPDMGAALRHWHSLVCPDGTVAFSVFGEGAFEPLSALFAARARTYGLPLPDSPRPFSWQRLTDPAACAALLHDAGFEAIRVEARQLGYPLPDAEAWWQVVWNSGFRGPLSELAPVSLARFRAEHLAEVAALSGGAEIYLSVPVLCARGRRPGTSPNTTKILPDIGIYGGWRRGSGRNVAQIL